jgi:hypothetical protein
MAQPPKPLDLLSQLANEQPSAAGDIAELASSYEKKLWHPLTLALDRVFQSTGPLNAGDVPLRLFESVVLDAAPRLAPLKLAQFAVHASKALPNPDAMIKFLQGVLAKLTELKLPRSAEPTLFIRMHVAQHQISQVCGHVVVTRGGKTLKHGFCMK